MHELASARVRLFSVDELGSTGASDAAGIGTMQELAEPTGCPVFYGSNDTTALVQAALDDSHEGYVLTLAPKEHREDRSFHYLSPEDVEEGRRVELSGGLRRQFFGKKAYATIPRMTPFLLEVAAALLVAAIVATFGYMSGKQALQKKIKDAAVTYVMQLEDLIQKGVKEGEYKALANASDIVTKCEAFREPLDGMRKELGGEIDTLAKLALQGIERRREVYATIEALQSSWPGKRRTIESETRRLLALLGVE
jgi:hypothetical protein